MVAPGVCRELDELKHLYHGLPDFLTCVVEAELQRIPRSLMYGLSLQQWTLIYMPQVTVIPPPALLEYGMMQPCNIEPSLVPMKQKCTPAIHGQGDFHAQGCLCVQQFISCGTSC